MVNEEYARLFNNVMHITLIENNDLLDFDLQYKALLKLKRHYAIPFTDRLEPLALYRILADYLTIKSRGISSRSSSRRMELHMYLN